MKLNGSAVVREFYRQEVLAQANEDLSVKKFMDACKAMGIVLDKDDRIFPII